MEQNKKEKKSTGNINVYEKKKNEKKKNTPQTQKIIYKHFQCNKKIKQKLWK